MATEEGKPDERRAERSELRQLRAAINGRWNIPQELRELAVAECRKILEAKGTSRSLRRSAIQTLVAMDRVNVQAEVAELEASIPQQPTVNVQIENHPITVHDVLDALDARKAIDVSPQLARAIEAQGAAPDGDGNG